MRIDAQWLDILHTGVERVQTLADGAGSISEPASGGPKIELTRISDTNFRNRTDTDFPDFRTRISADCHIKSN
jgi:hypothetical protein